MDGDHLGWKVGFGAPASMAALGIDRPLVGHLTVSRRLRSGSAVSIGGWTRPLLEAEVAAYVSRDLGAAATAEEALAAVGGWSVAIELADLDRPPDDVEEILAGNVYHRHVLLGSVVPELPEDLRVTVRRDGEEIAATDDPWALTGELGTVLASTAATLAAAGSTLRAGDVVITGSVVPPIDITPGSSWQVVADGLGRLNVHSAPTGAASPPSTQG